MNEINREKQPDVDDIDVNLFPELQELWDRHDSHIVHIISRPESQPRQLILRHATTRRRIVMAGYLLLAFVNIAAAIYASTLLGSAHSRVHIAGIVLMVICAFLILHNLYAYVVLHRHHPACVIPDYRQRSRNAVTTAFSSLRQMETACIAIIIVLLFVANAPVGDGHMMSATDRADRAKTIEKIETTLARI